MSHLSSLRDVLTRIHKAGLRLNGAKCSFAADKCSYLGTEISAQGQKPGMDKVSAVRETKPPEALRAVKSACGLFNYFRNYIYMYSKKAAPLHELTKVENVIFCALWQQSTRRQAGFVCCNQLWTTFCRKRFIKWLREGQTRSTR